MGFSVSRTHHCHVPTCGPKCSVPVSPRHARNSMPLTARLRRRVPPRAPLHRQRTVNFCSPNWKVRAHHDHETQQIEEHIRQIEPGLPGPQRLDARFRGLYFVSQVVEVRLGEQSQPVDFRPQRLLPRGISLAKQLHRLRNHLRHLVGHRLSRCDPHREHRSHHVVGCPLKQEGFTGT